MTGDTRSSNIKDVSAAIQRVLSGEENAYEVIHNVFDRRLRAFIGKRYRWAGLDFIEEVAARTHEYVLSRLDLYNPNKGRFFTWLCWQARSIASRVQAERFGSKFVPFDEKKHEQWAPSAPGPAKRYEDERRSRELWQAFDALPEDCRLAIGLHDLMGQTFEETAQLMGVTVGKLRGIRNRGRAVLKRRLQERGINPVEVDSFPAPIWHGQSDTGYDDGWTATVTAVLPDGPDVLVGAAAKDERKEEEPDE